MEDLVLSRIGPASRVRTLSIALVATLAVAGCSIAGPTGPTPTPIPPPSFGSSVLLPDLQMTELREFFIAKPAGGRLDLRFTAEFVNTGAGTFEVHGDRSGASSSTMTTSQVVQQADGSTTEFPTSAIMIYRGDDHSHWHVKDFEAYEIVDLASNKTVVSSLKSGFCLWDNAKYDLELPGAPAAAKYYDCGKAADLSVVMGVSVGWGDVYDWTLTNQYIDITGVKPGKYRLNATVDPAGWMAESNNDNNVTWVDLEFSPGEGGTLAVEVTGYGPSAPESTP
jgi:hypothetical protein